MMKSIVLAIAFATTAPAVAAPPTPSPSTTAAERPVDPTALAAADRLLTAMGYDKMMSQSVDAMLAQSGPSMKKSIEADIGQEVDEELIRRIQDVQAEFLRKLLVDNADMRRVIATLYARHFTAAEIDHLTHLYSDPVMRKWAESAPALMGDMMPLMIDLISAHRDELRSKLKEVAADYFAKTQAPDNS